jgi:hypothetical protein
MGSFENVDVHMPRFKRSLCSRDVGRGSKSVGARDLYKSAPVFDALNLVSTDLKYGP